MHTPPLIKAFVIALVASLFLSACANCPTHTGVARTRHHPAKKKESTDTSRSAPAPKPTPTPEQNPQPPEIHLQQLALIKGIAKDSFSADQAKEVLTEFAPSSFDSSGDPKKRLHVLISDTTDPTVLSKMGEKIPH